MGAEVPFRQRLLVRLLAGSVLVAVCSIAATAWLAAQTTSGALRQERGRALADDARVYDALLGHAAGHRDWSGAQALVRDLAARTGRRITLTTQRRAPVADSAATGAPLPAKASAIVDPLGVDPNLLPGAAADRIDRRAVGPFRLPAAERARLMATAQNKAKCYRTRLGASVQITVGPSGRPAVTLVNRDSAGLPPVCEVWRLAPTPTERKALGALQSLVGTCLERRRIAPVELNLDLTWQRTARPSSGIGEDDTDPAIAACIDNGRREQLSGHVAPAALLFIGDPDGATAPGLELSAANTARIAGAAALVLVLTVGVSFVLASRQVRPVHALTDAVRRMREGDAARVRTAGSGELRQLAAAFNEMSEHRDRLERQRKAMVGDVAHELRTPLSNIRGWLEAVEDGVADPDPALVARLLRESLLLQHIVDDLQDLAIADAGALRLRPEPLNAAALLEQVAAAHRGRAESAGVSVVTDAPAGTTLTADPVRLRQVVGNLVGNAIRHTPPGGRVTLRARGPVIEVADTGTGIAAQDLPHVFDRFWRAEKSRARHSGGSGLGLAIVRSLVEAHGGTVTAASEPGRGTAFTITLPE
ncbi:sensor histidine kinase [Spirillospora sp. CA-253888]